MENARDDRGTDHNTGNNLSHRIIHQAHSPILPLSTTEKECLPLGTVVYFPGIFFVWFVIEIFVTVKSNEREEKPFRDDQYYQVHDLARQKQTTSTPRRPLARLWIKHISPLPRAICSLTPGPPPSPPHLHLHPHQIPRIQHRSLSIFFDYHTHVQVNRTSISHIFHQCRRRRRPRRRPTQRNPGQKVQIDHGRVIMCC